MRLAHTAVILPLAALLAACGSSSDSDSDSGSGSDSGASSYAETSPEDIEQDVDDAMSSLTSLHMQGTVQTDDGSAADLDLSIADNNNCEGTMSLAGTGSFELKVNGDQAYLKADEEFWRNSAGASADAVIAAVGDNWVTASGSMSSLADVCNWEEFTKSFSEDSGDGKVNDVLGTEDVDGQQTVKVSATSDEGKPETAWVLADEPHYVVKIDSGEDGTLVLSAFNEPVEPEAPTDAVDLDSLQ